MALYFGYKPQSSEEFDDTELKKDISALKTGIATNNTKTKALETNYFNKDGSVQMTGDLDLGDNSMVGIHDVNPDNSVPSKKYVKDELAKKLSLTGGDLSGNLVLRNGLVMLNGIINMANKKIRFLDTPVSSADAATKKYVDDKHNSNATNITSLAGRITLLETKKDIYTYHFNYFGLGTNWSYPRSSSADGRPYHWMYCKDLKPTSFFHVHTFAYDTDASIDFSYILTFKLDFMTAAGIHTPKEIFTLTVQDHQMVGERFFFVGKKFIPSTLTGYRDFVMARLAVKGSSTKGNEFTVSCSFEI